jgi:anthranilate synthase component 1
VSHFDDIETLRKEIDRIDGEIVEKIAEWIRASKELGTNDESFRTQLQGLAHEHGVDVEGVERIFRVLSVLAEEGSMIATQKEPPLQVTLIKLPFRKTPFEVFSKLYKRYRFAYLLESIEGPEKLAQYSFIGFDPRLIISVRGVEAVIEDTRSGDKREESVSDPLEAVRNSLLGRVTPFQRFRLAGGAVGYISYDVIRQWEKLPANAVDDLGFPDLEMGVYDDGIVYDHAKGEVYYYYTTENRLGEICSLLKESADSDPVTYDVPKTNITKEDYEDAVVRAKEYIAAGDIFQVVPSKRFEFRFKGDLTAFYRSLREINPSPYMYYLKMGGRQIIGSSPEMLVRVDGETVDTFPIAGTCPRVDDPGENARLAKELLDDPKERAEHVMLVDLGRNDIGKVAKFGSVHLPEYMTVHEYSHVQHIVTQVRGTLREGMDCYDALRAVFPAGTVTGAPKVRAMEIIDELEPTRRGPYAGAVGYFSYNGNADFAITIRTLVADGDRATIQAGGGIVADSVPENEWFETEHKAAALLKALEASGGDR